MTTQEHNFRVESLVHNLRELQNEKNCLEQKLNEQRRKRRDAERAFETTNMKFMQVADIHQKMNETLKVAQLKVAQTQAQADSLEESNNKKRERIAELNRNIEKEKQKQDVEVCKFEEELSNLSNQMVTARNFHKDEHLEKEINNLDNLQIDVLNEKKNLHNEQESLSFELEALIQQQKHGLDFPEITEDTRRLIWNMFKEENGQGKEYLEKIKIDLEDIHSKLQESIQ